MIAKNRCILPDRYTERHTDRYISSAGPHWGSLDPSVGINYYCRYYTVEPMACSSMLCAKL